jgi:hypothetical protein
MLVSPTDYTFILMTPFCLGDGFSMFVNARILNVGALVLRINALSTFIHRRYHMNNELTEQRS